MARSEQWKRGLSEVLDLWHPQMIERLSPRGLAGVEEFKSFIRQHVSTAVLEERALMLVGLDQDEIDAGLRECVRDMAAEFDMPGHLRTGFVIAAADIVRELALEYQARGGNA